MMNEKIAKDLLLKIDWLMDEHFFKKKWAARIRLVLKVLNQRSVNYLKAQQ